MRIKPLSICAVKKKDILDKDTKGRSTIRILNLVVTLLWVLTVVLTRWLQRCTDGILANH